VPAEIDWQPRPRSLGGESPDAATSFNCGFGTNCTDALHYHGLTLAMGSELIIRLLVVAAGAFTVAAASVLIFAY